MRTALLIDIGSTYTKTTLLDIDRARVLNNSQAYTTVETDINIGLKKALKDINGWERAEYKLACSSAAGGLKIIAIGLVPELTAEAARRAALGAGSRVLKTYSYQLTEKDIAEIIELKADIILLAGGTDGGNTEVIIDNAQKIAESSLLQSIIVAGNRVASERIKKIFKRAGKEFYIKENVMPNLEKLNIKPTQELIRKIFLDKIIYAHGLNRVNEFIDGIIMPTPAAVLKAAEVLANGCKEEEGLGELMVIDIGGATTDVHSVAKGKPEKAGVSWRGLEEPYAKRTVEGDLGMRYSVLSLAETIGEEKVRLELNKKGYNISADKYKEMIKHRRSETEFIPNNEKERVLDNILGRNASCIAVSRHVGHLKTVYTPLGPSYIQEGKDLTKIKYLIGTGGIIVKNENPAFILEGALYSNQDNSELLAPMGPVILKDSKYLMAAAGLLAELEPKVSIKIMKNYLEKI